MVVGFMAFVVLAGASAPAPGVEAQAVNSGATEPLSEDESQADAAAASSGAPGVESQATADSRAQATGSVASIAAQLPASAAPAPAVESKVVVAPRPEDRRRLVFAGTVGLGWNILSPVPSTEVSLFLGSSLRPRERRGSADVWRTALGYELTVSAGGADYTAAFLSYGGRYGLVYHRHHLTAVGYGANNGRLYYAFGGGVSLFRTSPTALEADVKLGVVLGVRRKTLIKGMVGGQARIVGIIHGIPTMQLGVFAGLMVF
ncbi:MAG: hypothetical protein JNL82_04500 [Myxococcales bacterium]|nr:hypothetical protein [Myxococcales bacterium]